jgi:hypothetical protein
MSVTLLDLSSTRLEESRAGKKIVFIHPPSQALPPPYTHTHTHNVHFSAAHAPCACVALLLTPRICMCVAVLLTSSASVYCGAIVYLVLMCPLCVNARGRYLNGEHECIAAVAGLDSDAAWYPAATLAGANQLRFNFGRRGFLVPPPSGCFAVSRDGAEGGGGRMVSPQARSPVSATVLREAAAALLERAGLAPTGGDVVDVAALIEGADGGWPPQPLSYFEVHGAANRCEGDVATAVGFAERGVAALREHCTCICSALEVLIGAGDSATSVECCDDAVVGCGISLHPSGRDVVFFTVHGAVQAAALACSLPVSELLPFVCGGCRDINFGASPFAYENANTPDAHLAMAQQDL